MPALLAIALQFIILHRTDGGEVAINPRNVTSLHSAVRHGQNKVVHSDARCAVLMSDGKLVSVIERCDAVRRLLEEAAR